MIVHHEISTKPHRETENDSQLIKVDFKDFSWTILMPASYAPISAHIPCTGPICSHDVG